LAQEELLIFEQGQKGRTAVDLPAPSSTENRLAASSRAARSACRD